MPAPSAQPEPAEGPRDDEATRPEHEDGEGVSSEAPAEGGDDAPAELPGSPRG